MSLTPVQQIRLLIQDVTPGLYIISDEELEFLLERNNNNINRTSVEAARIVLFNLSMNATDSVVDVFSLKSSTSAKAYIEALKMYINNPALNQVGANVQGYVGGISLADMQANDANTDNNIFINPTSSPYDIPNSTNNYFGV